MDPHPQNPVDQSPPQRQTVAGKLLSRGNVRDMMDKRDTRGRSLPGSLPAGVPSSIPESVRSQLPEHLRDARDMADLIARMREDDKRKLREGFPKPLPPGPRLTVIQQVVYQAPGDDAVATDKRYSVPLTTTEQPCPRKGVAGPTMSTLAEGQWVKEAGIVVMVNDEKEAGKIIQVGSSPGGPLILVPPGESCLFRPADMGRLWVRCPEGEARYTAYVYPR